MKIKNKEGFLTYKKNLLKFILAMKFALIFMFLTTVQIFGTAYSQSTRLTLDLQDASVSDALKAIENQSDFKFLYYDALISTEKNLNIKLKNKTVEEILNYLLASTDNTYSVLENNLVVISRKEIGLKQEITVTGKVTAEDTGEPLPGVNINVKGTVIGTITNIEGEYTIVVPDQDAVLIFSYLGYASQEVTIGNQTMIDIVLTEDIMALDELVVIGYGTQRKGDITSSVASVNQEDFIQGSVQDAGQLIQGKVAGLTIYAPSGDPVAGTQLSLRGNTTLTAGRDLNDVNGSISPPLVIVDGIPGDMNSVAPEDIVSIDVLKDGSAAAIYGTRGTNGVILITTKRASGAYQNKVSYSGYISTQTITKKLELSTAADVRQQIADGYRNESYDLGYDTDWLDEVTRTPVSHVHNLTVQGGNEETNYLVNINYKALEGIFLKSENNVGNLRADINHFMFNNKVKINVGAISRHINYQTTGDGYSFNGYIYRHVKIYNPTAPVKNEDGTWYEDVGGFNYDNPVSRLMETDGENKSQWNRINGTVDVRPIKGLSLKALLSYSKYNETRGYYETKKHISTLRYGNNGYASNGSTQSVDRLAELTAEYSGNMGNHNFTALAGYSYQDNDRYEFWQRNTDFPTDAFGYNNIDIGKGILEAAPNTGIASQRFKSNLIAFFGRATYNYSDKYLILGSVRYEAASELSGTDNPWGLFPAVSVGWRLSNEPFMQDLRFISDLKLRAGYGVTGTKPSRLFLGKATLDYSDFFFSNGEWTNTLAPSRNPNPELRWEEKKETNIGLDYAFFDGRINGAVDFYNRKIDGLLYEYPVPVPPNLVSTTTANVGEMSNTGIEVLCNLIPVRKANFQWTTGFTYSTNKNKLLSLSNDLYEHTTGYINTGYTGEPIQTYTHRIDIGEPLGNFYGFKVVDVTDEGRWIYEDANGDHVASNEGFARVDSNKMVLGNGLPKHYASWQNTFRYKNFDLGISMRGAFGFQILNFERMYLENTGTLQYNRLRSAYDPIFGKAVLSTVEDLEYNSYYIEDGDYWKIDNITLGYNFKVNNSKYFKSARIYVATRNTFTITKYKGLDPEVQIDGLEPGNDYRDRYPTTRTYTLGFNVNF